MQYLLDTHAILWYVDAAPELPAKPDFAMFQSFQRIWSA